MNVMNEPYSLSLRFIIALLLCLPTTWVNAQEQVLTDTLAAAIKTAERSRLEISLDRLSGDLKDIQGTLSPLGEGDPIRWVLNLPGVTTGAEGGSAFYVRGGNLGNNLLTLDDVPVYGYSHLLGLTTIVPVIVMQSAELAKGGFDGSESNFTASHLAVETKSPSEGVNASIAINNFLVSAGSEGYLTENLSYIFSARISPLAMEYKTFHILLPKQFGEFDNFKAGVGDLYGKLRYSFKGSSHLELSGLGSIDEYSFSTGQESQKTLGWRNGLTSLRFQNQTNNSKSTILAYFNHFDTHQIQDAVYHGKSNHLTLESELMEYSLSAVRQKSIGRFVLGYGAKGRYAEFKPGQVASIKNRSAVKLANAFIQTTFKVPGQMELKAIGRMNYYQQITDDKGRFNPEYSLSAKIGVDTRFTIEGSFDHLVQYYHTLEGLPVGWSLDMIVPSGARVEPENVMQGAIGIRLHSGAHCFSAGGFYKRMDKLLYYKYSQSLFNGGMADWEAHVSQGQGQSYGAEILYEYNRDELYARLAYTLSKTDRRGFEGVNEGKPFHARFDRTHILNVQGIWRHLTLSLILESGHWENGAAATYLMHTLEDSAWRAEYYSGINNYRMPTVFRLDGGYQISFFSGRLKHDLNLGISNMTNHFNPFMLYFDGETNSWKEISLLPIMPNISYRISF